MTAHGSGRLMPAHDVLALDWLKRPRNAQPLRCCKPRLLGSNGWTQSLKASVVGGGDGNDDNVVQHSSQTSRPGYRYPNFGASFSYIGLVPRAVRRVSVDRIKAVSGLDHILTARRTGASSFQHPALPTYFPSWRRLLLAAWFCSALASRLWSIPGPEKQASQPLP